MSELSKIINFFTNQGFLIENEHNKLNIKLNKHFSAIIVIKQQFYITLEYLDDTKIQLIAEASIHEFWFDKPNRLTLKATHNINNVGDLLTQIRFCIKKLEFYIRQVDRCLQSPDDHQICRQNPNSTFIEISPQSFFELTQTMPGNTFKPFFLIISPGNIGKNNELQHVKVYFKKKSAGYKLIYDKETLLSIFTLTGFIKQFNDRIQSSLVNVAFASRSSLGTPISSSLPEFE